LNYIKIDYGYIIIFISPASPIYTGNHSIQDTGNLFDKTCDPVDCYQLSVILKLSILQNITFHNHVINYIKLHFLSTAILISMFSAYWLTLNFDLVLRLNCYFHHLILLGKQQYGVNQEPINKLADLIFSHCLLAAD
jgi:hypothetical protein